MSHGNEVPQGKPGKEKLLFCDFNVIPTLLYGSEV